MWDVAINVIGKIGMIEVIKSSDDLSCFSICGQVVPLQARSWSMPLEWQLHRNGITYHIEAQSSIALNIFQFGLTLFRRFHKYCILCTSIVP